MNPVRHPFFLAWLPLCAALAGCSSTAVNTGSQNTFLSATDLVQMTDQMATAITADADVARVTAKKPMIIVIKPIINDTNEIIPAREKELYVARVQGLMAKQQALRSRFVFVLNRSDYENLVRSEGVSSEQLGPVEAATIEQGRYVPEYALSGRFYAQTNANAQQRSDYYLCTYQLTNIASGELLWEGTYEVKKHVKKELLD